MAQFAKKSLGQNFLQSPEIREKILTEAGNISEKNILEIGPGLGFLTTKLLQQKPKKIKAIELDPRSVKILTKDFGHMKHFELIQGDILQQDIDVLWGEEPYAVIANIPYNITSPIVRKFLANTRNRPEFMILMVQKEVGEKICNPTKRSLLSLSVEIFAQTQYCFDVGREWFSPIPKVDSAIIKITSRPRPLVDPEIEADFFTVVQAGFSQKRKKIGNYIGGYFGLSTEKLLEGIDHNRRAETLSVDEWIQITYNFRRINTALS